nr:zinc finger, CCHC-type, retrotransposon Gag domain protein [Tanacetum cinerariifolium]
MLVEIPPPVTIHAWLERFNKQKPYSFEKATVPVDAENWISHMEKIFDVMGCEDAFKTRLAVYKLRVMPWLGGKPTSRPRLPPQPHEPPPPHHTTATSSPSQPPYHHRHLLAAAATPQQTPPITTTSSPPCNHHPALIITIAAAIHHPPPQQPQPPPKGACGFLNTSSLGVFGFGVNSPKGVFVSRDSSPKQGRCLFGLPRQRREVFVWAAETM